MSHQDKAVRFLSDLVLYDKYSHHIEGLNRRQTWYENVDIVRDMHISKYPQLRDEIISAFEYVYNKKVMPSMRSIQYGGWPIELNNARVYNCSYAPIDHAFVFAELFFLLLSGTGTGYSVRGRHVKKLPPIVSPQGERRFLIGDSIEGWADATRQLIFAYMKGKERPRFDYRGIRPRGSKIKSGGVSKGFQKLKEAHENIEAVLKQAVGRRLTDLECHDILCYQSDAVLAGGIRDAAMISLFDITSKDMMTCKSNFKCLSSKILSEWEENGEKGYYVEYELDPNQDMNINIYGKKPVAKISLKFGRFDLDNLLNNGVLPWYYVHPQRGRANNSVVLRRGNVKKKDFQDVFKITKDFGEPGFIWTNDDDAGFNPCAEVALNPNQFCNLTSTVVYDVDTQEELNARVKAAAFIGTLQAGYTDFHYIRAIWKETTEREALLGVSMTGIASGKVLSLDLKEAAQVVLEENERVAGIIGINPAARTTLVKPEGSGTLAMGVIGSGVHSAHDRWFIRNVRLVKGSPLHKALINAMPNFVEDDAINDAKAVVSIPIEAPEGIITRDESIREFLERVKRFSIDWVKTGHRTGINTHNVSATVSVRENEWEFASEWAWENRDIYSGLSFIPFSGGNYKQSPFMSITKKVYDEMIAKFPADFDFTKIVEMEETKNHAMDSIACQAGACEV